MGEDRSASVFSTGHVRNALAAYRAGRGIAVRAVSRHRPAALADADQGTGAVICGLRHNLPWEALQAAFARAVTSVDGI
jgi:hypothetical protein